MDDTEPRRCYACRTSPAMKGGYCAPCRSRYERERRQGIRHERTCTGCGTTLQVSIHKLHADTAFCSRACKDTYRNATLRAERASRKAQVERNCPHCGTSIPPSMRAHAVYCSAECNSAAHQATRKARMKITVDGEVRRIPRAYIIERDNATCHICRKRCAPNDIQIDHVIPLSRGGTHTLENLRVSCARCNASKGNRAVGEQLMLVG